MFSHSFMIYISALEVLLGIAALVLLVRARELRTYWPMLLVSMWQVVPFCTLLYLRQLGKTRVTPTHAYHVYYFTYWLSFVVGAISSIAVTYTILHGAMRPLKGLQRLGKIVYFWAAAISLFIALDNSLTATSNGYNTLQDVAVHFQRASGIITVSLILFVCFAVRPMGLSLRSRIFGTSVGLGLISVTTTIVANALMRPRGMFSPFALMEISVSCLAEVIWIWYFSHPEPKRKFVLLATTSPFHAWNRIAEQFGAEPGFVAIGGVPPDAFATAEMEVFHLASSKGVQGSKP